MQIICLFLCRLCKSAWRFQAKSLIHLMHGPKANCLLWFYIFPLSFNDFQICRICSKQQNIFMRIGGQRQMNEIKKSKCKTQINKTKRMDFYLISKYLLIKSKWFDKLKYKYFPWNLSFLWNRKFLKSVWIES